MKARIILSAIAIFCFGFMGNAQDIKIGYTNVDYIMSLMPEMEQIEADIQDYSNQLGQQLQTKRQNFEQQAQAFQQTAETMTEEAMNTRRQELMTMQQELQKFQSDAQASYDRKLTELLEPVQTKVYNAINSVAAENNYTHVLAEAAGQAPVLLYTKDDDPFTDLVLTKLGLEAPAGGQPDPSMPGAVPPSGQ
ncbi:periplasmic chaperone for outer membrane proteins Skp [Cyclobacterium lianum]|uniref:Periplasmic chaperone for outer membrane proteins Skp n=1 Tax=Cyclobacterium lianum TaxID=388280 RepID=A0A1M7PPY9_9BACT|nr:OmpH family outer membrane protein [Cyclobacterium lianum]SHN19433.1 periplasmic chaperone for outer membrane proteins Skp [Cyclobacterium lianum]